MAGQDFIRHFSEQTRQDDKFNFKPKIRGNWRLFLVPLGLAVFLTLLLIVAAPILTPHWQEIKNSSAQIASAIYLSNPSTTDLPAVANETGKTTKPINFLLLGEAGQGYDAPDLTDTILVAHFLPDQNKIYLFSLPRDLLVKIPSGDTWTKLNTLYAFAKNNKNHEFDLIIQAAQNITGLTIDHYVLVDLNTVKDLVDTLGGVNVMVKKDIYDTTYPGPNHSYQTFSIQAGWRYLDGETALKYIRSRHSEHGDFDRIERQQQILQALKQKVLTLNFWDLPTFLKIFDTVASRIKTDMGLWQIKDYWDKIKDIGAQNIIKTDLENPELVITGQTILGGVNASIVQPRTGLENYEEIQKYIINTIANN